MTTGKYEELIRRLDDFAKIDPPCPRWLGGDNADAALSYCPECAEKAVAEGKGEFVDGGWNWDDSDDCCHCTTCGQLLGYSLTKYGVGCELEHFASNPPTRPLDADTAFHIARVVEAAPENAEALALGEKAVALLA